MEPTREQKTRIVTPEIVTRKKLFRATKLSSGRVVIEPISAVRIYEREEDIPVDVANMLEWDKR